MALELDTRQRAMLQEMGVQVWLPHSGVAILQPAAAAVTQPRPAAPALQGAAAAPDPVPRAPLVAPAPQDWTALREAVRSCQACARCSGRSHATLLAPTADQTQCDWLVLGDPPDEDEDRSGAPFAGPDGVLLDNMLRALGLQRGNALPGAEAKQAAPSTPARRAYLTNVLKCRPAHGAMPQAAELAQCAAYLQREMALVQPKIILALGRFANQLLLGETPALVTQPLGKLRGSVHHYQGLPVVVSYPPKLLLRNSADKAKAWADLCLAADTLNLQPAP
jgi:DNA polymerase